MKHCDVVITGVGAVSPLGIGLDSIWNSLVKGESGIRVRKEFVDTDFPFRIAGDVNDFDPKQYVKPRKALKVMCRPIQFGVAASMMANEQSGIVGQIEPERICTVFGTEAFYADPNEVGRVFRKCIVNRCYDHDRWGQYAMREIEPLWMLKYLPNMVASHISIALDAQGPSNTICQSEASSLLAIIEAVDMIDRGVADAVIAGGTGCSMSMTGMIYRGIKRLSKRVQEPTRASRPFDSDRDGMVVGEGAGVLVLERADFAAARGAKVLGRIAGFNRSYHQPNKQFGEGIANSISAAIRHAELTPADIGHVNAHGFSTLEDDIFEAQGIRSALGDVPVTAPKSSFGNLGPGTGTIELATCVESCRRNQLFPTINIENQDERCPINLITKPMPLDSQKSALALNFTDTGQIVSMVISV